MSIRNPTFDLILNNITQECKAETQNRFHKEYSINRELNNFILEV
jgi:hypothetical protein